MSEEKQTRPFIWMLVFILLMVLGINLGEVSTVWTKAAQICLSCIGIG